MNWCKLCSVFPKTAKDYLTHLHSDAHKANIKTPETPWHESKTTDEFPTYPNAAVKRTPIRGLQFFVPVSGWYCQLCSAWMGDLHCASTHLKSQTHSKNYTQHLNKNPKFESDWENDRERANRAAPSELTAPPPPIISSRNEEDVKSENILDLIPLQLNQKKEPPSSDDNTKKSKKKKKDKKKRKKSKKKRQQSSSSSSSSSSESDSDDSDSKVPIEQPVDTAASIRVAMRNTQQMKIQPSEEDIGGKWTVIREGSIKPVAPQPPTISESGEAENKRDEMIISQWNAPEPVINDKEKQMLEQLKERMKFRDVDKKKVEVPSSTTKINRNDNDNQSKPVLDKRQRERSVSRGRDRRDRKRSRSHSPSPRKRRSRSPRRDYRRRSRSPRRIHSRNRRSRSRSRGRIEKAIVQNVEFKPRVPDVDKKKDDKKKTRDTTKKSSSSTGQKPSFIGRMPVFKKQTNPDDENNKKQEQTGQLSEEQRLLTEMKTQELKFQIQQKQQLIHQQQKHAELFNLAHPGAFANEYNSHGCIDHILPPVVAEDYEELMPDPMQFHTLMTGSAPPPPPVADDGRPDDNEPVLPPGKFLDCPK